jgi:hypothetical protein
MWMGYYYLYYENNKGEGTAVNEEGRKNNAI